MSKAVEVISVDAPDITKGMRVYRRDRYDNLKLDFTVGDPFTTSGPGRLQPIAFHTTNGVKVFSLCSVVEVGTGRGEAKTEQASRRIGRNQRKAKKR